MISRENTREFMTVSIYHTFDEAKQPTHEDITYAIQMTMNEMFKFITECGVGVQIRRPVTTASSRDFEIDRTVTSVSFRATLGGEPGETRIWKNNEVQL